MNSVKIVLFLWQMGVVDSLTLMQFFINCGAQYTGVAFGEVASCISDVHPRALLF